MRKSVLLRAEQSARARWQQTSPSPQCTRASDRHAYKASGHNQSPNRNTSRRSQANSFLFRIPLSAWNISDFLAPSKRWLSSSPFFRSTTRPAESEPPRAQQTQPAGRRSLREHSANLKRYHDALRQHESPQRIWLAYASLTTKQRRMFFTRDDYLDVLHVVFKLNKRRVSAAWKTVFEDMMASDTQPLQEDYETGIALCSRSRQVELAETLFKNALKNNVQLGRGAYENMMRMYGREGDVERAAQTYQSMVAANYERNAVVYDAMIDAACRSDKMHHAMVLFKEMGQVGLKPTVNTFAALILGCVKSERIQLAEQYLAEMRRHNLEPTLPIYTLMINGYSRVGKLGAISRMRKVVELSGFKPDMFYMATLIASSSRAGKVEETQRHLETMRRNRMPLNRVIYESVISGLLYHSDLEAVMTITDRLAKQNVAVGDKLLTYAMVAFRKMGDYDAARALLESWSKKWTRPIPVAHFRTYLHMCASAAGVAVALQEFRTLVEAGNKPHTSLLNPVLQVAFTENGAELPPIVIQTMLEHKLQPDSATWSIILANNRNPTIAFIKECMSHEREHDSAGLVPLLRALTKTSNAEIAIALAHEQLALGVEFDKRAWTALAQAHGSNHDLDNLEKTLHELRDDGWAMDVVAHTARLHAYITAGDMVSAHNVWRDLCTSDCTPTPIAYSIMLKGLITHRDFRAAWALIADIHSAGIHLDTVLYTQLIICASRLRTSRVLDILTEMDHAHVAPDLVAYNTMLNVCRKHKDTTSIPVILNHMLTRNVAPDGFTYTVLFDACFSASPAADPDETLHDVLHQLASHNVPLCDTLLERLMAAHGRSRDPGRVMEMWGWIVGAGIEPGARVLGATIRALLGCGWEGAPYAVEVWERAGEVVREAVGRGVREVMGEVEEGTWRPQEGLLLQAGRAC
ncbi:uncharacterized protein EV422DRAFT_613168 [Fimicolochytrium jonesii]|uniref:uncharacterized protein n=1 Tax=Fimicolochytrium jonesii TaxID=1396493 RepID=UPI0022FDDFCF|nr:uncharacterized protein EV422DRAFT_613168 [Fimicolochytrium jonesii]KAI8823105.1 hypothetical protein EV422DRAFT_613168 [Fimicolochytrium jonesii]